MKKKFVLSICISVLIISLLSFSANAEEVQNVCCEQTTNNLFCQNVPVNECAPGSEQAPTSCESTSFCKPGVCYGLPEGICMENTPRAVCEDRGGKWSETSPAQCELGCCTLGDQAAFVSLVRCKKLASDFGLPVNYNKNIQTEAQCIQSVRNQDKGACVFEFEFERTCKFTTRELCSSGVNGTSTGEFFSGRLCSDPELNTNCAPTKNTVCVAGKEEVYFADSCGNPANVYDANKITGGNSFDVAYWSRIIDPSNSCSPGSANINSRTCGNCDYLQGSICRPAERQNQPNYGDNICANLNCIDAEGNPRLHGESWCVNKDAGRTGVSKNSIGSRFYKHICLNGEEVVEQCADFRQEECIEDKIVTASGVEFSQAACRVNRWEDCTDQPDKDSCENRDRRDCVWKPGQSLAGGSGGTCVPLNSPGLKFWEGEAAQQVCAQANAECIVVFEKDIFGDKECVQNCECLTDGWVEQRTALCGALGDCGPNVNWINKAGYTEGFKLTRT